MLLCNSIIKKYVLDLYHTLYKVTQSRTLTFTVTSNDSVLWQNDLLTIRTFFFFFFKSWLFFCYHFYATFLWESILILFPSMIGRSIWELFFSNGCLQGPVYKVKPLLKDSSSDVIEWRDWWSQTNLQKSFRKKLYKTEKTLIFR